MTQEFFHEPDTLPECVVVFGNSSAIARAMIQQLSDSGCQAVLTVGREASDSAHHCCVDLTQSESVAVLEAFLRQHREQGRIPGWYFHCSGILHDGEHWPEKGIAAIQSDWLSRSLDVNLLTHVHAAQAVDRLLSRKAPVRWASLSAMVGSIGDNRMGGWHSYRISKAALNMFVRGLDVEWRRKNVDSRVVAIHPGATESELSRPFRRGLPVGRPFSAALTAARMIQIMASLSEEQSGHLLHWDGHPLPF